MTRQEGCNPSRAIVLTSCSFGRARRGRHSGLGGGMAWYGKASTIDLSDWERGGGETRQGFDCRGADQGGGGENFVNFFF